MSNKDGFTLIEMIVVVAIIGLLSAVVITGIGGARQGARDAKRISDLRQIQNLLEIYYSTNNAYPPDFSPLPGVPADPLTTNSYAYARDEETGGQAYALGACLERERSAGIVHSPDPNPSLGSITNTGSCTCDAADNKVFCIDG